MCNFSDRATKKILLKAIKFYGQIINFFAELCMKMSLDLKNKAI